ncbi:MAG: DUF350 domain-containing protein [Chloroflexi bacterium]|jgi:uncharacterized membrane protein YjfL (UPF0719 family)|nr:DUF350 domain-containing protein [Chloroflexota bacterium]
MTYLENLSIYIVYAAVVLAYIWIAKKWRDVATRKFDDDKEIEQNGNMAVGLRRFGLYLGLAIGMSAALTGETLGFVNDLKTLAIEGALVLVMMMLSRFFNDAIILHGINNDDEAQAGNTAVGLVEAGSYIATGLIMFGAFSGGGGTVLQGYLSAMLFAVLGQVSLLIFFQAYEFVTSFNVREEVKAANPAAGLAVGCMLVALGVLLRASIAGDFQGWMVDIKSFALSTANGILLLLIFRKVIDWLFLPNTTLRVEVEKKRNVAAVAVTQACILALAIIIAGVI